MELPDEHTRQAINRDRALSYIEWLGRARPGWKRDYHHGYLARDREFEPLACALGALFWVASVRGLVLLVQRRDGDAHTYMAVRTSTRLTQGMRAALERLVNELELPHVPIAV